MSSQSADGRTAATVQTSRTASRSEIVLRSILERADIRVAGDRPWDLYVHNPRFYGRVLSGGELALGESYMDGWWDCEALDEFVYRVFRGRMRKQVSESLRTKLQVLLARVTNRQSRSRAFEVGEYHYDLGNDLFEAMLDRRLTYSCAYWNEADTLDAAQEAKLDLICQKIGLQPGQNVLDIGAGWGSFMGYAADHYEANATGITISREQAEYVRRRYASLPVDIRVEDYREHEGTYDHVVSVGMFEHVGEKNYRTFMEAVHRSLKDDGLFLLHTIVRNRSGRAINPWTEKYIFPNGMLPAPVQISRAIEGLFVIEDLHNFGADYDPTLLAWHANFAEGWPRIAEKYGSRFFRMWKYYLLTSAGAFRARQINLWQIVLSKRGVEGGYNSLR